MIENKDLYKKLYEVKKEGVKLVRDTEGYGYKYATLGQIQEKLGPILEKNNLLVLHYIKDSKLITEIRDLDSDGIISSEIDLTTTKPQDKGSEITYFRRYNLLALLDLEVEDLDGVVGENNGKKDIMEFISRVRMSGNVEDIKMIYDEFNQVEGWTDKQVNWFKNECTKRKENI